MDVGTWMLRRISPWKLGLSSGFVAQHRCIRLRKPSQVFGRHRGTAPRSGRTPFTTFTIIWRMLFSPGGGKRHRVLILVYSDKHLHHSIVDSQPVQNMPWENNAWMTWTHMFTLATLDYIISGEGKGAGIAVCHPSTVLSTSICVLIQAVCVFFPTGAHMFCPLSIWLWDHSSWWFTGQRQELTAHLLPLYA